MIFSYRSCLKYCLVLCLSYRLSHGWSWPWIINTCKHFCWGTGITNIDATDIMVTTYYIFLSYSLQQITTFKVLSSVVKYRHGKYWWRVFGFLPWPISEEQRHHGAIFGYGADTTCQPVWWGFGSQPSILDNTGPFIVFKLSKIQAYHNKKEMVQKIMHRSDVHFPSWHCYSKSIQDNNLKDSSYDKLG